jgi:dipeptidyl aminopeptidase/acylaminoacyl peptidase
MPFQVLRPLIFITGLLCLGARAHSASATLEELMRGPFIRDARLSPDGRSLGALATENNLTALVVYDLETAKTSFVTDIRAESLPRIATGTLAVSSFDWLDSRKLLFNVSANRKYAFGLYVVDLGRLNKSRHLNFFDASSILKTPKTRSNRARLWIRQSADRRGEDGGAVEIDTTKAAGKNVVSRVLPVEGANTLSWISTFDGETALTMVIDDSGRRSLHRIQADGTTWKPVPYDFGKARVLRLDPDGRRLWSVVHDAEQGFELRPYDLDTGAWGEAVHRDKNYDYSGINLLFSTTTGALQGFSYKGSRLRNVWLDPVMARLQGKVDSAYPATENRLVSRDDADTRFVFTLSVYNQPADYVLLDTEKDTLAVIANTAPWLKDKPLRPTQSFAFTTRDGVRREAYLTLPEGASKARPVPLVVMLEPNMDRADGSFNPAVQYLAGLGYGVVQPNYRGALGYAQSIDRSLRLDTMHIQMDVVDATTAALRIGCFDPARVALVGSDYTGYLSMIAAAENPQLYRCVAAYRGVLDWDAFVKKLKEAYPGLAAAFKASLDAGELDAPLSKLTTPVLLVYPGDDMQAFDRQSDKFAAMLKRQGGSIRRLELSEETANLTVAGKVRYHRELGDFLARHLGSPPKP